MTDQLSLYNGALRLCGERELSSLSENREPRRLLDSVWTSGGVDECLEMGQWHFAMRAVQLDYDPAISPAFGFDWAFSKPSDWILTSALCVDESFQTPILNYIDEAGYWYANEQPIYIKYVSNAAGYGTNYSEWPISFARYVEAYLAGHVVLKVTGDPEKTKLVLAKEKMALDKAKNKAAMALPTQIPSQGSWNASRLRGANRERGNRGTLIG